MSGQAATVVQAGSIQGGGHVHARHAAPSPARPITQWHPFDLDVHRAATFGTAHLPDLPTYLPRDHDRALVELLAAERTVMAVLTGESSTGKTRALYEAVAHALPAWPLVHPRTAEDLLHVLATGIGPGTVLWLNETQNHLLGTHGEPAAAALRTLLEPPGPFVVVGTLWPQYWSALTGTDQPRKTATARRSSRRPSTHGGSATSRCSRPTCWPPRHPATSPRTTAPAHRTDGSRPV